MSTSDARWYWVSSAGLAGPRTQRRSFLRVGRNPTEDPYAPQAKKTLVTERADGAQVETSKAGTMGARRDAFVIRVCIGDTFRRDYDMRKYIAPVQSQACRLDVCVGRSTQTSDTRASTGLLRLEFELFRKGYSIAPVDVTVRTVRTCLKRLGNLTRNTDG